MRLAAAANRFNRLPCFDAYTGAELFNGQLQLFDDTRRDSETAVRRVLSVQPGTVMPARRVVRAAGKRWIIGHDNPDAFNDSALRVGYVVHEAGDLAVIRSLGQLCRAESGVQAWASRTWIKDHAFTEQTSALDPSHHIHFSTAESVPVDSVVQYQGTQHIVRTVTRGTAGTLVTYCDEMLEPSIEVATLDNATFDPVAGSQVGSPASVRVVRMRWQSLFRYRNGAGPSFGPEDQQIVIAKAAVAHVQVGARLTLSDGSWVVGSVVSHDDVWLCKATQHG